MMLIKGGRIVDPKNGMDQTADLVIENGKIKKIGTGLEDGSYETVIDASGCVVAPGLIDVHVHFRDPGLTYKEDIQTGAAAAKKGGFTTVVTMANTKPPVDSVETLKYVLEEGKKTGINVMPAACISVGMKGQELTDMKALKEAGAAGFTDDGIPIMDVKLVKTAMEQAKELNVPLSFHEEDPAFITENGINAGETAKKLGITGSPALAEDSLVARDCMIALHTGAAVNIQHISSKNAVKMVKLAKELGANVTAEVTPHHFTLDETAVLEHGAMAKMNPPLRTAADREAIIEGIKDGTIDMIATDHAPHSPEEKAAEPMWKAPSGIIGLETALALAVTNLVKKGHLTTSELMEKMSLNPAKLYHFDKGTLSEGADADIVIFNEDESWTVTEDEIASKSCNTPFLGQTLYGRVKYTICGGAVVYEDKR
jgi:dihydroorotase